MINLDYSKKILNAFFNTSYQVKHDTWFNLIKSEYATQDQKDKAEEALTTNKLDFPVEPVIALFTTVPEGDTPWKEPTYAGYSRVSLTQKGPGGKQIMNYADDEENSADYNGRTVAVIKNQDIIVFPEITQKDYSENVKGFGVFDGAELVLWGELTTASTGGTPIKTNEIPVFRTEQFVFKLA